MSRSPILFPATAQTFTTKGIGTLSGILSCYVTEGRNSEFDLEMEIPESAKYFPEMKLERILYVKPNPYDDPQPFRIYKITKPINGISTVFANHISYDLNGIPVDNFTVESASEAAAALTSNAVVTCPFTITTDIVSSAVMTVAKPYPIRSMIGGEEGSFLDVYGGEIEYDGFEVHLLSARGMNRGVKIRYGINLLDLTQEENCSEVYTGVLPYYHSEKGQVVGTVQRPAGTFDVERIMLLDCTDEYDSDDSLPTASTLNAFAQQYITDNKVGVPKVSLDVSFIHLDRKEVHLCDTVTVSFERIGIEAQAKVIETVYDVINDRYTSVKIGDPKENLPGTFKNEKASLESTDADFRSYLEKSDIAIRARVTKTGGNSHSFGWDLSDTQWVLASDSKEVFKADNSGVHINGDGTFTGTVHATAGEFTGTVKASTIQGSTITGGSININDAFVVDSAGNLTANSGTFAGNIYAKNIQYGGSTYGTFNGAGITGSSITTGQTSSGINLSLGYADFSNEVFNNRDTAAAISAINGYISADLSVGGTSTAGAFQLTDGTDVYGANHVHNVVVNGGRVTIGTATTTVGNNSFNIADTQFYRDGVSAVTISSIALNGSATYQTANKRYAVSVKATASNGNSSTNTLYVNANDAYNAGYNAGYAAAPSGYSSCTIYDGGSAEWGGMYYQSFYTETDSVRVRSRSPIEIY